MADGALSRPLARSTMAAPGPIVLGALGLLAVAAACSYDFEAFDPRLGEPPAGGAAGQGTGGGAMGGGATGGAATGGDGGAAIGGSGGAGGEAACTPGASEPCYTGPAETEGQGICHGGQRLCNDDGTGFGPCEGEVTPLDEDCETPVDDDCDGQANEPDALCECIAGEVSSCYEGPAGTQDQGACHAGQQICAPSGTAFGPCYGQMTPRHEECGTAADDDCDGSSNTHCALWSRRYGGSGFDMPWGVAVDASDNVVVVGEVRNSANFAGTILPADSQGDAFVSKLDPDGAHLWSKRYGAAGTFQAAEDVATDGLGNVYVTGEFENGIDFGGGFALTSAGEDDVFVAAFDAAGNTLWAQGFGGLDDQRGYGIAVAGGHVVVTGVLEGTFSIGTTQLDATTLGVADGFVAQLDAATGAPEWALRFGGTGVDGGYAVAVDGTGAVYLGGAFDEVVNFGGGDITDVGSYDAFMAKLDSAGGHLWSMGFGALGNQEVDSIVVHPGGGVLVAGEFDGTLALPIDSWVSAGLDDIWVARITADGTVSWGVPLGGPADEDFDALAVDPDGNMLLGGAVFGPVDFGDGPLVVAGDDDWLALALDPSGAVLHSRRFGDPADQNIRAVAVDSAGRWVVAGGCDGQIDLGNGLLTARGSSDICIGKLAP